MKKFIFPIILSSIFTIYGNNGDKNKINIPNENSEMNKTIFLRPTVIATHYGSLFINGWQGNTLVVTCYDSPDLCVQIVRHDDGSLWAYLYLDRVITHPISSWQQYENQILLNVIE